MEEKLNIFYQSLVANPNVTGLPNDYDTFKNALSDPEKAKSFYSSLSANPAIKGIPSSYDQFASSLDLLGGTQSQNEAPLQREKTDRSNFVVGLDMGASQYGSGIQYAAGDTQRQLSGEATRERIGQSGEPIIDSPSYYQQQKASAEQNIEDTASLYEDVIDQYTTLKQKLIDAPDPQKSGIKGNMFQMRKALPGYTASLRRQIAELEPEYNEAKQKLDQYKQESRDAGYLERKVGNEGGAQVAQDIQESINTENWGERNMREASERMQTKEVREGFWYDLGSLIPQMGGSMASLAVSAVPGMQFAAAGIGYANAGAMGVTVYGSSLMDVDQYAKEKGIEVDPMTRYSVAIMSGLAEYAGESIRVPRILPKGMFSKSISRTILDSNPALAREFLTRLVAKNPAAKETLTKLMFNVGRQGFEEATEEGFTQVMQSPLESFYKEVKDQQTAKQFFSDVADSAWGGFMMGTLMGVGGHFAESKYKANTQSVKGIDAAADKDGNVYEVIGETDNDYQVIDSNTGLQRSVAKKDMEKVMHFSPDQIEDFKNGLENTKLTPDEEAVNKINTIGKDIKYNNIPLDEDPDAKVVFVLDKTGNKHYVKQEAGVKGDNFLVVVNAETGAPGMIKATDVVERKEMPYGEWFANEKKEYDATMQQIGKEQATVASPYKPGQPIEMEGKKWVVSEVAEDGSLIADEIDEEGMPGDSRQIAPEDFNKIVGNTEGQEQSGQDMSSEEQPDTEAQAGVVGSSAASPVSETKPQARKISDGKNELTITPMEDGNFTVDQVFNTAKSAETTKNKLQELYPKVKFEVQVTDSGDAFTPDDYRIIAKVQQKQINPEPASPVVDETASAEHVEQKATQENAAPAKEIKEPVTEETAPKINDVPNSETSKVTNPEQVNLIAASDQVESHPSEEQKKAGNYKKGHTKIQGLDITIENPAGTVRSGVSKDGKKWGNIMNNTYGYIKRTKGKDGDQVDVFLGDKLDSQMVFVVDQVDPGTGKFDEHKVMMGFSTSDEAKQAYQSNYDADWKGLGEITAMSVPQFKQWLGNATRTKKPVAQYKPDEGAQKLGQKKGWPMSKEDQKRLERAPQSFEEAVFQFFLSGGRISMSDYYTHFGNNKSERLKNIWMYSKEGIALDKLNENAIFASHPELLKDMDAMDQANAFADVARGLDGKNDIRQKIDAVQGVIDTNDTPVPQSEEDESQELSTQVEELDADIKDDPQLMSIFDNEKTIDGKIDWDKLKNETSVNPGYFTIFPYGLNDAQLNELKSILSDGQRQEELQARADKYSNTQSSLEGDDSITGDGSYEGRSIGDETEESRPVEGRGTDSDSGAEVTPAYGSKNTFFTADAAQAAIERLRAKRNNLNSGIDPETMLDGITVAGYHIEAGARKFADFVKVMVKDLGDAYKPYLKMFYNAVRDYPGFNTEGMDAYEDVSKANVNDINDDVDKLNQIINKPLSKDKRSEKNSNLDVLNNGTNDKETGRNQNNAASSDKVGDSKSTLDEGLSTESTPVTSRKGDAEGSSDEDSTGGNGRDGVPADVNDRGRGTQQSDIRDDSATAGTTETGSSNDNGRKDEGDNGQSEGNARRLSDKEGHPSQSELVNPLEETTAPHQQVEIDKLTKEFNAERDAINARIEDQKAKRRAKEKSLQDRNGLFGDEQEAKSKAQGEQILFAGEVFNPDANLLKAALKPFNDAIELAEKELKRKEDILNQRIDLIMSKVQGELNLDGTLDESAEEAQPTGEVPEIKAESQPKQVIEDFGEKIEGAKKDIRSKIKKSLDVTTEDILSLPLSKTLPPIDYRSLVDNGIATKEEAALLNYMRKEIGLKPKSTYNQKRWLVGVKAYMDVLKWVTNKEEFKQEHDGKSFTELMNERLPISAINEIDDYVKTLIAVGFPETVSGLGKYKIKFFDGVRSKMFHNGENAGAVYTIVDSHSIVKDFPTWNEAAAGLKYILATENEAPNKVKFDIWSYRNKEGLFIGKKVGPGKYITLVSGVKDIKEARNYISEHQEDLEKLLEEKKIIPNERPEKANIRNGKDYRNGANVTPEQFTSEFGFRGVQFGNYVEQTRRQEDLNNIYDAIMDLSELLNIPPKAISLGGKLGIAFGARGNGGKHAASAHYEPVEIVINITKEHGPGSFAHEWFHAVDNYFERQRGNKLSYITDKPRQRMTQEGKMDPSVRPEVLDAFNDVVKAIWSSGLPKRSGILDSRRTKDYWGTTIEMAARSFESYVKTSLAEKGITSDYLVSFKDMVDYLVSSVSSADGEESSYPYPTNEESGSINTAFDKLFKTIQTKEDEAGNVPMFQISDELEDINQRFNDDLQKQIDGKLKAGHVYELGYPSDILLSAGLPNLPIQLISSRLKSKSLQEEHPFDLSEIKDFPNAIQDPIAVFLSATHIGSHVILTEISHKGKNFIVAIEADKQSGNIHVNSIRSVHYRNSITNITNWIEEGLLEYVDKKKTIEWLSKQRYNSADVKQSFNRIAKIVQDFQNPNISSENQAPKLQMSDNAMFQISDEVYFSPTLKALEAIKQEKGTPEQWKAMLLKNGAKQAELDWMGLDDLLNGKKSVTKSEIRDYIEANKIETKEVVYDDKPTARIRGVNGGFAMVYEDGKMVDSEMFDTYDEAQEYYFSPILQDVDKGTKYNKYTLPGGDDYHEMLLTMPYKGNKLPEGTISKSDAQDLFNCGLPVYGIDDRGVWGEIGSNDDFYDFDYFSDKPEMMEEISQGVKDFGGKGKIFQSGHWSEENVLAHVRFDSRTSTDGRSVLFIEEIQSDWAQKGKKEGFIDNNKSISELPPNWFPYNRLNDRWCIIDRAGNIIIEAPRSNNTREGAIEAAIKRGVGGVPDMPFKQTDQWAGLVLRRMIRYAIDNGYDAVAWTPGQVQVERYDLSKKIDHILYWAMPDGKFGLSAFEQGKEVPFMKENNLNEDEIENYVGKEIAKKIVAKENPTEKSGETQYGIIPNTDLKVGGSGMSGFYDQILPSIANKLGKRFGAHVTDGVISNDQADQFTVHTLPITDAMFNSYREGIPLFRHEKPAFTEDDVLNVIEGKSNKNRREIKGTIDLLSNKLHTPIYSVESREDLPAKLQEYINRKHKGKTITGVFDPETDSVYIIMSEDGSAAKVTATVLHEIVSHKGLRELLGSKFDEVMDDVYDSMDKNEISRIAVKYETKNHRLIADEYIAEMAESDVKPSQWHRFISKVRQLFRRLFKINYTTHDIENMLHESKMNLYNQAKPKAVDFADRAAEDYLDAITAWHGTGSNFDKFSSGKIGSGTNLLLKGYGLYFTDMKEVAEEYALKRADRDKYITKATKALGKSGGDWINKALVKGRGNHEVAIKYLNDTMVKYSQEPNINEQLKTVLDYIGSHPFPKNRYLYEVMFRKGKGPEEMNWVQDDNILSDAQVVSIANQLKKEGIDNAAIDIALWDTTPAGTLYDMLIDLLGKKEASMFLSRAGIDGMKYQASNKAKNYLIFNDEDVSIMNKYRFQISDDTDPNKPTGTDGPPINILQKKGDLRTELWQNRMLSVREWQNSIKAKGGIITELSNPYRQENLSHSIAKAGIEAYDKHYTNNLLKAVSDVMKSAGMNYNQVNEYMMAKHAPERNNSIWREQQKASVMANTDIMPEEKRINLDRIDASEAPEDAKYSGYTTKEANTIVDNYESRMNQQEIDSLWKAINDCTHFTLDRWLSDGFINKETYDKIAAQYNYYVPLRNWKASLTDEYITYQRNDVGKTVNPLRKARGRKTIADDPMQYIINMAHTAIVTGEKNRIKQHAARLVRDNKGMKDLHRFKKVYAVWDGTVDENGNKNYNEVLDKPAKELWEQGMVKLQYDMSHNKGRAKSQAGEHEAEVFFNGEKFVMVLPADVANAINKTPSKWDDAAFALREWKIGQFTRWLSSNFTSKNPAFIPINMMRDLQYATLAHFVKGDTKEAIRFAAVLPKARRAIIQHIKGKGDPKDSTYKAYQNFIINGGETGYIHLKDVDQLAKEMKKELSRLTGTNSTFDKTIHSEILRKAGSWMEEMAIRSENLSRFASYLVALEQGKSNKEAAYMAKEITVNFNRKGRITGFMGAMYAFFNASLQGGDNIISMGKKHPGKFFGAGVVAMSLGFVSAMLNTLWGDDDDDELVNRYKQMNDYTKYNNMVIVIPGVEKAITFPLPHGFRWFHSLGVIAYQTAFREDKKIGGAVKDGISQAFSSLSPVNPVEFIGKNGTITRRPLVPTFAVPFYDVLVNEDFAGYPIHKEPFTRALDGRVANSALGMKNVNNVVKTFTDQWFKLGHGDPETGAKYYQREDGTVSPVSNIFDINPSNVEHFIEYYLGGRGMFWNDVYKTATGTVESAIEHTGEDEAFKKILSDVDINSFPVVKRLLKQPYGNTVYTAYYDIVDDIDNYKSMVSLQNKSLDIDQEKQEYAPEYQYKIDLLTDLRSDLDDINEDMQGLTDKSTIKELKDTQELLIRNFINAVSKSDKE